MVTLISFHTGSGDSGRCDEKCYNATSPVCTCCCGGANHGVGLKRAEQNTVERASELIKAHEKRTGRKLIFSAISQEELF